MSIQEIIDKMKIIHQNILTLIEDEDNLEENFQNLLDNIKKYKIKDNQHDIKSILYLILKRYRIIIIEHPILLQFQDDIKKIFTNDEIFDFFKSNKRILLFFIENKTITINDSIVSILSDTKYNESLYHLYFLPEITPNLNTIINQIKPKETPEDFEKKRKIGENDKYICQLIRNDSISEFITYVNQTNLTLTSLIEPSEFETNPFLLKNKPSLIEYAAFFGSVQIFKYLYKNQVFFEPSMWSYAIHGQNPELIQFLKDNNNEPENKSYFKFLKESIKCHHNGIANYILANSLSEDDEKLNTENNFDENVIAYGFRYYNYEYIRTDLNQKFTLFYLVEYDYYNLFMLLLKSKDFDLNKREISNDFMF